jgi:hypothetical protein
LIEGAANKHCLAFAGIALDPEQPAAFVVAPLLKIGMFENPLVRVSQQPTLRVFDPLLVLAGICYPQVLYTTLALRVEWILLVN